MVKKQLSENEKWLLSHLLRHAPTPYLSYGIEVWRGSQAAKNSDKAKDILRQMSFEEFQEAALGLETQRFLGVRQTSASVTVWFEPEGREQASELADPDLVEAATQAARRNPFLAPFIIAHPILNAVVAWVALAVAIGSLIVSIVALFRS